MALINNDRLPCELLLEIFERLDGKDVFSCTVCCKDWSQAAISVLYKHVVLAWELRRDSAVHRFIAPAPNLDVITSLSLRLHGSILRGYHINHQNARDSGTGLLRVVPLMPKLTTFSLSTVPGKAWGGDLNLPFLAIREILLALPTSVLHLELIFCGKVPWPDLRSNNDELHDHNFCVALKGRMPHLHTLNLCVPYICADIFDELDNDSPLRNVTMSKTDIISHTRSIFGITSPRYIAYLRRTLSKPGRFRDLQSFVVVSHCFPDLRMSDIPDGCKLVDLVSNVEFRIHCGDRPQENSGEDVWFFRDADNVDHLLSSYNMSVTLLRAFSPWRRGFIGAEYMTPQKYSTMKIGNGHRLGLQGVIKTAQKPPNPPRLYDTQREKRAYATPLGPLLDA